MTGHTLLYRSLLMLYPRSFRRQHGSDLLQAFRDLSRECRLGATWARCGLDLAVTVPRYHVEILMQRSAPPSVITVLVIIVGLAGMAAVAVGGLIGLPVLAVAAVAALAQRTELARSLTVSHDQRRARLGAAAGLAATFVGTLSSWIYHVGRYDHLGDATVLAHNVIGMLALVGAIGFGLAGLLTKRSPAAI